MKIFCGLSKKNVLFGSMTLVGFLLIPFFWASEPDEEAVKNPFQSAYEFDSQTFSLDYSERKEMALKDSDSRIAEAFDLPESLDERVRFWFDVYSKYDSKNYIIHNRKKPWIIYEVVTSEDLFARKKPTWMNRMAADERADKILKRIRRENRKTVKTDDIRIQLGQKDFFTDGLVKSSKILPLMERVFIAEGLPSELARIPLVESSFNHTAESKVGAKGIWQIMPAIGRRFMVMNEKLDERKSPLKATRVAAYLLEENKMILGHWPLAVTAYNHGTGGMRAAKKQVRSSDLGTIIKKYKSASFQFASSNFYSCFLAALHAEKYKDVLFPEVQLSEPTGLAKLKLNFGRTAVSLSKDLKIDLNDLILHNPDLYTKGKNSGSLFLPKGFSLFIPGHLIAGEGKIPKEKLKAYSLDAAFNELSAVQ